MTRRVMPRMNSDGYFCVVLIADVRHMSKTDAFGEVYANAMDGC